MRRVEGKVGIVTGAGSGIGRAVAHAWAREGASVVIADIDGAAAVNVAEELTTAGCRAVGLTVDVADEDAVRSMVQTAVDEFGRLDMLHNNAALTSLEQAELDGDVTDVSLETWNRTLAVNLTGPMLGCKHAIPHMLATGGGAIVNTSSMNAINADRKRTAYGASKAGVDGLTLRVAAQFGPRGIRCNSVRPGYTVTDAMTRLFSAETLEFMRREVLTPALGRPEDIADLVLFLTSDESRFINAQCILIDGGQLAHHSYRSIFVLPDTVGDGDPTRA